MLLFLREHAPEDCRNTVMEDVADHREIVAAGRD